MAETLPWAGSAGFQAAPLAPFTGAGVMRGGEVKAYRADGSGLLLWVQVDAAGHMVPLDQPAAAAEALAQLLKAI